MRPSLPWAEPPDLVPGEPESCLFIGQGRFWVLCKCCPSGEYGHCARIDMPPQAPRPSSHRLPPPRSRGHRAWLQCSLPVCSLGKDVSLSLSACCSESQAWPRWEQSVRPLARQEIFQQPGPREAHRLQFPHGAGEGEFWKGKKEGWPGVGGRLVPPGVWEQPCRFPCSLHLRLRSFPLISLQTTASEQRPGVPVSQHRASRCWGQRGAPPCWPSAWMSH